MLAHDCFAGMHPLSGAGAILSRSQFAMFICVLPTVLPRSRISQLMGVEYQFDLMLSTDGSGRGAALVAAVLKNQPDSRK